LTYYFISSEYGLVYARDTEFSLTGYSDSGWVGSLDDRKSTTYNLFNLGSGAISWISKKQNTVSLPSTEAEYKALVCLVQGRKQFG